MASDRGPGRGGTPTTRCSTRLTAHPEAVRAADDVGLSIYPEEHPLGAAFDPVVTELHAAAAHATLLVSEVGY